MKTITYNNKQIKLPFTLALPKDPNEMVEVANRFNGEKIKVNTDKNEFKIIDDVKDEPTLEQAQKFVGGYVEGITFPNGDYLIINEEGKLQNLPLNVEATNLWRSTFTKDKYMIGYDDFVVGPAILIKKDAQKIWAS